VILCTGPALALRDSGRLRGALGWGLLAGLVRNFQFLPYLFGFFNVSMLGAAFFNYGGYVMNFAFAALIGMAQARLYRTPVVKWKCIGMSMLAMAPSV